MFMQLQLHLIDKTMPPEVYHVRSVTVAMSDQSYSTKMQAAWQTKSVYMQTSYLGPYSLIVIFASRPYLFVGLACVPAAILGGHSRSSRTYMAVRHMLRRGVGVGGRHNRDAAQGGAAMGAMVGVRTWVGLAIACCRYHQSGVRTTSRLLSRMWTLPLLN